MLMPDYERERNRWYQLVPPEVVGRCELCGEDICKGDEVMYLNDLCVHEDCANLNCRELFKLIGATFDVAG